MKIFGDRSKSRLKLAKEMVEKMRLRERQFRSIMRAYGAYDLASKSLENIIREVAEKHIDSFVDAVAEIYADAFSASDLKTMIAFFDSAVGKKYVNRTPGLEHELGATAEKWANVIRKEIAERYQAESLKRRAEQGINASQYIPPLDMKF